MDLAKSHCANLWPEVIDVSAAESFDLLCRDGNRELRRFLSSCRGLDIPGVIPGWSRERARIGDST